MLKQIAHMLIRQGERRVVVTFDYVHQIAKTDLGLLFRYNKIFGFLDPNKKVSPLAYHTARLRGAVSADCGTCVEAEINLALNSDIDSATIDQVLSGNYEDLPTEIAAVATLADAVMDKRSNDDEARETVRKFFGEPGLIEISFAMNGAALLPGVKRAMGYATSCDMTVMRKLARTGNKSKN